MYRALLKDWRLVGFSCLMLFVSSPGQTILIALFGEPLRHTFELSNGQFGSIYSALTLLSALLMLWLGQLADHVDLRKLVGAFLSVFAFACWLLGQAESLLVMIIGLFLMRHVGQGLITHLGMVSAVRYFDSDRGKATAITSLGFALAEATLPIITVLAIAAAGWRWTLYGYASVLFFIALPLSLWLLRTHDQRHAKYRDRLKQSAQQQQKQWRRGEILRHRRFYLVLPALLSNAFFSTGFLFHQASLVAAKGWQLEHWASLLAVYAVVKIISNTLIGPLVDRFGAQRHLPFILIPLMLGLVILALGQSLWAAAGFLALLGVNMAWSSNVASPYWADCYGTEFIGAIKSMISAMMVLSTALSPVLLGVMLDNGINFSQAAWASVLLCCIFTIMAWRASTLPSASKDLPTH